MAGRPVRYPWLGPDAGPLYRDIGFDEVVPHLDRHGIAGTVLVQSDDDDRDTEAMLELARVTPRVLGVVAYLPLHDPERAARRLAVLRDEPLVVDVRNLIHERSDPDWMVRPGFDAGLGLLEEAGLPFDVVGVLPRHLELVPWLAAAHPGLTIVIDHLNKPPIGAADREPWWTLIAEAAAPLNVRAKVSGLYSAAGDLADWSVTTVRPFFERALEVFGPERLMYGGDWPVSLLAGGYDRVWEGVAELVAPLTSVERERILAGTAIDSYGLDGRGPTGRAGRLGAGGDPGDRGTGGAATRR